VVVHEVPIPGAEHDSNEEPTVDDTVALGTHNTTSGVPTHTYGIFGESPERMIQAHRPLNFQMQLTTIGMLCAKH
jgi:hypothetical protein